MDAATTARRPAPPSPPVSANLVELVLDAARRSPDRSAFVVPGATRQTVVGYGDLAARVAEHARAIRRSGLAPGARILVLRPPDAELYAFALAVLATGRTLVVLDGRGRTRRLLAALADARADAILGPPSLLRWWPLVGALRRARRFDSLAALLPPGRDALATGREELRPTRVDASAPAIVSFSSGNTGRPKAAARSHGVLGAQHAALAAAFPLPGDDVNLPGFPLAALHNLCSGTTTVLPAADLRSMAEADPGKVLALIHRCGVTSLSGAPAFLSRLSTAILASGAPVEAVRRIAIGGGPVGRALCARIRRAFPLAAAHVVYGASEAEPIAAASIDEVLAATDGEGFLVGRPTRGTAIRLFRQGEDRRQAGEIAVRGAHVSGTSDWHRTGDVGRLDDEGRLWLLGRVGADVVHGGRVLHPFVAEAEALALPGIRAAALVAHRGAPGGEMIVELEPDRDADAAMEELRDALGRRGMATLRVRRHAAIPMDARHGSKVARAELIAQLAWEGR